jgi:hypothetical protein
MGWELPIAIFAIAILFAVIGAFFIKRISGGAMSARAAFVKPFKILVAPFYVARVGAVFVLVVAGIAFLLAAPYYVTFPTVTGYRYDVLLTFSPLRYIDQSCSQDSQTLAVACRFVERLTIDRAVTKLELIESPVRTYVTQLHFRTDFILFGLAFIIAGTILTAYFLSKINTEEAKAAGVWVEKP